MVLIAVPGPSVVFIVSRAVAFGRRVALLTVVGNAAGEALQVGLVAVGVGELLERSVVALSVLRLVGAAYLVYLGVRTLRSRSQLLESGSGTAPTSRAAALTDGMVVGATNPKTAVFFVTVLPAFVAPGGFALPLQILTLGSIWVGIALISDSVWGMGAARAGRWLRSSRRRRSLVGAASGAVTTGLGVGLALTGLRS